MEKNKLTNLMGEELNLFIKSIYDRYDETYIKISINKNGLKYETKEKQKDYVKHVQIIFSFLLKLIIDERFDINISENEFLLNSYFNLLEMIINAKKEDKK